MLISTDSPFYIRPTRYFMRECIALATPVRIFVPFFFQAEDGIRYGHVTGVQTCALPIWTPQTSDQAADGYSLAAGAIRVDLSDLVDEQITTPIDVELGAGNVELLVPDGMPVVVTDRKSVV